ncbi:hypothetical protein NEOLEDRAFT_220164 [Neolentinus lepideus HHB14362 ss-1]|uniref:Uncharacterized protein n=1 Tax=Neolentinus lepideus HHB14362 ss-1 TaxID=1314782 RepID=A0A165MAV5_9AGAM|nr:hypothetical protein NEOLEDRAFT_220164 [Neolentinus lepideus HHB14362 ss-1]
MQHSGSGDRECKSPDGAGQPTKTLVHRLLNETNAYWSTLISASTSTGTWKEVVHRTVLALKLSIY